MQYKTSNPPCYPTINTRKARWLSIKKVAVLFFFSYQPRLRLGWLLLYFILSTHHAGLARKLASPMTQASTKLVEPVLEDGFFFILLNRLTALLRRFVRLIQGPPKGWLRRFTYVPLFWKKDWHLERPQCSPMLTHRVTLLTQKLRLNFAPYSVANRLNFSRCSPAQKVVK